MRTEFGVFAASILMVVPLMAQAPPSKAHKVSPPSTIFNLFSLRVRRVP